MLTFLVARAPTLQSEQYCQWRLFFPAVPSLRGFRAGNTSPTTQQNQFRAILHFAKCSNTFAFIQHMFLQTNAKSHDILAYAPSDLFARYYRFARTTSPTIASLLPRCERLMSGDRATENARLWGRILEQCAAMRICNTTSSIASSTYRRLVRRLRPHNCEAHLTPLVGMIFVKWE